MECLVCGRNYKNVGVHAKHKHGLTADEYRAEFGLMKTAPLVDAELSRHLSTMAKIGFAAKDEGDKQAVRERCRENNALSAASPRDMSVAGRAALGARNAARNSQYLEGRAEVVRPALVGLKTALDVRKAIGGGHSAIVNMRERGLIGYDATEAKKVRRERANATVDAKRQKNIEQVLALYETEWSNAEICRRTGTSLTTYKRWVALKLIPRRQRV